MIVIYNRMEINRTDRKARAFSSADSLVFNGDVHRFQIKATQVVREQMGSDSCHDKYHLLFNFGSRSVQFDFALIAIDCRGDSHSSYASAIEE